MGFVVYLFLLVATGIGSHAQTVAEIHKEQIIARAKMYQNHRLTLERHEEYLPVPFADVRENDRQKVAAWRTLRSQHDENGYWLDAKAR